MMSCFWDAVSKMGKLLHIIRTRQYILLRIFLLRGISKIVLPVYRFKWPYLTWWDNKFFNEYLEIFNEINGLNTDRRWMLSQVIRLTMTVPDDTAECGVYQGSSSYIICKMNMKSSTLRMHHIFDSFEGVSAPGSLDGGHWEKGNLSCPEDIVRKNLAEFSNIILYQGWIPGRFCEVADRKFSFVHIDVDLFEPTRDSLEFFYPRVEDGGVIICDDYGSTLCPGATKACDDFLADKPEKMLAMSGGGGFLIKGVATFSGWGEE